MAEGFDPESNTEAPSPRRLQQSWDEGKIPLGRDLVVVAALAAFAASLMALGPRLGSRILSTFAAVSGGLDTLSAGGLATTLLPWLGPVAGMLAFPALAALVATLAQTRGGFWSNLLSPDLSRLVQGARALNFLRREKLMELGLALAKVVVVGWALYGVLRGGVLDVPAQLTAAEATQAERAMGAVSAVAKRGLFALAVLGALELWKARWQHTRRLRMTREEVKREHKEDEGDPMIKGRRRRRHRELIKAQVKAEVPRADVVLVNPTHIAVALRYRKEEGGAPKVVAKGNGLIAEQIRALAREHAVPIYQDIPLARLLYRKVKVGRSIPADTYKAVAAVLAFAYRLGKSAAGEGRQA